MNEWTLNEILPIDKPIRGSTINEIVECIIEPDNVLNLEYCPYSDTVWSSDHIWFGYENIPPITVILATPTAYYRPYILFSDRNFDNKKFSIIDVYTSEVIVNDSSDTEEILQWVIRNRIDILRCWLYENTFINTEENFSGITKKFTFSELTTFLTPVELGKN